MRSYAPWIVQFDERILEQLASDDDVTSWEIGFDLTGTVSPGRVTERCKVLLDAGLVDRYERKIVDGRFETYWSITTWGQLYLSEEVNPGLDVPEPGPRPPHATRPGWWAGF
ncbi:helix-turn-helix domain-containing protein [Halorubrum sp. Ea8]|uniref:MarR family transcriptional regulator n=1 Tax=Halorubrum sp. Ea8 TaxID=1383841 RepID=UPI000B997B73|nr:helix-turn-helix domain-containing protein [Halorubrum sp. Ea8]OYR49092.1 repressor phrH2 [Halorubrum sp. Ea8]